MKVDGQRAFIVAVKRPRRGNGIVQADYNPVPAFDGEHEQILAHSWLHGTKATCAQARDH